MIELLMRDDEYSEIELQNGRHVDEAVRSTADSETQDRDRSLIIIMF
jgi:hypothetical protein